MVRVSPPCVKAIFLFSPLTFLFRVHVQLTIVGTAIHLTFFSLPQETSFPPRRHEGNDPLGVPQKKRIVTCTQAVSFLLLLNPASDAVFFYRERKDNAFSLFRFASKGPSLLGRATFPWSATGLKNLTELPPIRTEAQV